MENNETSTLNIIIQASSFIVGCIACVAAVIVVPEAREFFGLDNELENSEETQIVLIVTATSIKEENEFAKSIATPTIQSKPQVTLIPTTTVSKETQKAPQFDERDIAAQTLGYVDLDSFMAAFEIPIDMKPRIFVCPGEETWCLTIMEESGEPEFHFKNILDCDLDGKQSNGTSFIPLGYDGLVRGFTVRPCR